MKTVLLSIAIIYCVAVTLLFVFQRHLLYFPAPEYEHDLPELRIANNGATLKVIVLNPQRENAIIYFGGNAEPVIFNEIPLQRAFPNHTIYLVNYRGYGGSTGQPTEADLYADSLAAFDTISPAHSRVAVIGRSLGSGVATFLASHRSLSAMALITPYDSIVRVAQAKFPIFPVALLMRDRYDSYSRAASIQIPTLIVMAEQDKIIPNAHSRTLLEAFAPDLIESVVIKDADHNNLSSKAQYYQALVAFLDQP